MKKLLFITCLFGSQILFAQINTIKWGTLKKPTGGMMTIIPKSGDDFFALRRTGGSFMGSYQISKHQGLDQIKKGKIRLTADNSMAVFEEATCINDKLYVLLSDKKDKKNQLYIQEYDENIQPKGVAIKLCELAEFNFKSANSFKIIQSRDRNYLGIIWENESKKEFKSSYGYRIFNNEINNISEGTYELSKGAKLETIHSHHLSNTGDYFISVIEYDTKQENQLFKNRPLYKSFNISHVTPEGLDDYALNLKGKRVEQMTMNSDDTHLITITGLYSESEGMGVSGIFHLRLDFDKQNVESEGFQKFGVDFITKDWTKKEIERSEKKKEKGKGEPQLYNYEIKNASVLKDGSILVSIEQFFIENNSYSDPRTGTIRTNYIYQYNDIITYKIGVDGRFDWILKIPKQQISSNDYGPFSSYHSFIDGDKISFIFNDNTKNYNENGTFIESKEIDEANFGTRKNAVSIVQVDINTGQFNRSILSKGAEIESIVIPKLFITDYISNQLILYAISGRKEKFGILKMK